MTKTRIFILFVLLLAGGAWFAIWQSRPVAIVGRVTRGTAVRAVPANILISEEFRVELKSDEGGRLLRCNVRKGTVVKTGDILFEIDPADLQIDIEKYEVDLKALKARIALGSPVRFQISTAEENVRNNTRLVEQGRLASIELERSKRAVDELKDKLESEKITNQQEVDRLENTLKLKNRQKEKMKITAPFDGTITEMNDISVGSLVGAGQVLSRLISKERSVQAQISEENFAGVVPGLPATVQLLGYGTDLFQAKVERVLPTADERTKRYLAFLKVEIPEEKLVPGMTGEASITIDKRDKVLVAEKRSLVGHELAVVKDGRVKFTHIIIGFNGITQIEVQQGVGEGEEIILEQPAAFRDGERVRVKREASE